MNSVMIKPTQKTTVNSLSYRRGVVEDARIAFDISEEALADFARRMGSTNPMSWDNPDKLEKMWQQRRSLFEHLADSANEFWLAERDGRPVGYARSTLRGGHQELTDLFVRPEAQSTGAGRELITRAFADVGAEHRSIIATTDSRAQRLYLGSGVYPRCLLYHFGREPEKVNLKTDLEFEPVAESPETIEALAGLDMALFHHRRDVDHQWLLSERQGYLYHRRGRPVGYGYLGKENGPFALLDPADFPAVLAHAESDAAKDERQFGVVVPTANTTAMEHLLRREFRLDWFMAVIMTNKPFGQFDRYIVTSPPFFF